MTSPSGALLGLCFGVGLILVSTGRRRPGPRRLSPPARWWNQRAVRLRRAGLDGVRPIHLLLAQGASGAVAALCVAAIGRSVSVAGCFALFAFVGPGALVDRVGRRRELDLRDVWPDAIDNLASAVRAGLPLAEAVAGLGERGPRLLRPACREFGADYRATGRFGHSLDRLKARLEDPVADRVCETLRLVREVGGTDVGRVLRTLSTFLREDARIRNELEARQSWTVNAARLAVCAPWLVLLLLASQATSLRPYDNSGGVSLLVAGGLVSVAAYRLMLRIGRLPEERRVLS